MARLPMLTQVVKVIIQAQHVDHMLPAKPHLPAAFEAGHDVRRTLTTQHFSAELYASTQTTRMDNLRRSRRYAAICYDSNGRECVADQLRLTRTELEVWLALPTVHSHLQLWYNLCVVGRKRFKDGREWIETGEDGYFYNSSYLEEDLLLMCLEEGDIEDGVAGKFANRNTSTFDWITQELWARTIWRIVQDNRGAGQIFETQAIKHPAAAYGSIIDLLTISFHSIVFRGGESIWHNLILGGEEAQAPPTPSTIMTETPLDFEVVLDRRSEGNGLSSDSEDASSAISNTSMLDSDDDFELPQTPKKASKIAQPQTPVAPKKAKSQVSKEEMMRNWLEASAEHQDDNDNIVLAPRKTKDGSLYLFDQEGQPITGYRMASQSSEESGMEVD
ncbi:hypothetical protein AC578_8570 [Pseudocercospora eumusae]|uniref:Uncharacterized protein n=1 Tax=Pseudocercospora eumusae TaxID=321146 RepID=A0A139HWA0_9PEZI|nr:hypothetical protein AC578_8570 [Pseudocercospora eumusae]